MANWKKIGSGLGVVAIVAAVGAGWWAWNTFTTRRSSGADNVVRLADIHSGDAAAIRRGEYVMRAGDCAACHTRGQGDFAGGYEIATPFGKLVSSNITPDRATGIGNMTEREFFDAVRHGRGSNGFLYPAMPYTAYAKLTDQDMHDLWAYISTVRPVRNDINENGGMRFPYNIRLAMAGWNMLFFDNNGFEPDSARSAEWNRGKYLVDGGGHCSVCHSPRNALGAEQAGAYLQGSDLAGWYAPDITSNPHTGIGASTPEDLATYLRTGSDGHAVAAGPMAEVVEFSTQYLNDDDLRAIGVYLASVPASPGQKRAPLPANTPQMQAAALSYEVNCSACHGLQGEGIPGMAPAFAGNHAIMADNASNSIHAMLMGARAPHTRERQTAAGMPSFAWKLSDRQIAALLTYIRNSWGNGGTAVREADVATMRSTLGARQKLTVPPQ